MTHAKQLLRLDFDLRGFVDTYERAGVEQKA